MLMCSMYFEVTLVAHMEVEGQTEVVVVEATGREVANTTSKAMQSQCRLKHLLLHMWVICHSIVCREMLMISLVS